MCEINITTVEAHDCIGHSIAAALFAIVGVIGNTSSIYLIWRDKLYNSANMALLINLCGANLFNTLFVMPLVAINGSQDTWILGDRFCEIFGYLMIVVTCTEFHIVIIFTVHQYLSVVKNINLSTSSHYRWKIGAMVGFPWLLNMPIYTLPLNGIGGAYGFDPRIHVCTLLNLESTWGMKTVVAITTLLPSLTIVGYCYVEIYRRHHSSQRRIATSQSVSLSIPNSYSSTIPDTESTIKGGGGGTRFRSSSQSQSQKQTQKRNAQLIRMIALILVNITLTYVPFMLMYGFDPCLNSTPPTMVIIIVYLTFSHCATNPIIYALMNKQIQNRWKQLIQRCFCRKRLTSSSSFSPSQYQRDRDSQQSEVTQIRSRIKAQPIVTIKEEADQMEVIDEMNRKDISPIIIHEQTFGKSPTT